MATYRCLACEGLYTSPQDGFLYFHSCPPLPVLRPDGTVDISASPQLRPNHRDENVVQVLPGPETPAELAGRPGVFGEVHTRRRGPGRVKLSDQDLLTGADAARLGELRAMAGTIEPDV